MLRNPLSLFWGGDKNLELKQRRTIVTGALLLSNIMAGMDGTIVNTALPAITSDLHALQYMGWIVAIFLFGMAVATPLWSKFGEHKGNKIAYISATSLFAIGAIFQGLAPNIIWFIIARAIMGIGAGGMNTIPFIVFAEIYTNLKKRATVLGLSSACFGTASIIGPLLGGWIVDALSWHWVFYVNVPIALIAITIIAIFYKNVNAQAAGKPIDYLGATLLVSSLMLILIAVQLIGVASLPVILGLMIIGGALLWWMVKVDQQAADPIVPNRLFTNHELVIDFMLFVIIWGSFIAFVIYIPMWAQGLLGLSALRDVPIATSMGYLMRILSQTFMSAIYGVILNNALLQGIKHHHGITMGMLNKLSNAKTASSLPGALLPEMRHILYNGYRNIVITALTLITISLVMVVVMWIRNRKQSVKRG